MASPGDRKAEDVLALALDTQLCQQLCLSLGAASESNPAAASSALAALASLVHCPPDSSCTGALASHFPVAASGVLSADAGQQQQAMASSSNAVGNKGEADSDGSHRTIQSCRSATAEALQADSKAVAAIRSSLSKVDDENFHQPSFLHCHS